MERATLFDGREHGVTEQVFETRPPRVVEFLERRHDAGRHLVNACRVRARERVERNDLFGSGLEKDRIVGAVLRHEAHDGIRQVAVDVHDGQSPAGRHVLSDEVQKERGLPCSRRTDDVDVPPPRLLVDADQSRVAPKENAAERDGRRLLPREKIRGRFQFQEFRRSHLLGGHGRGRGVEECREFFVREKVPAMRRS